MCMVSLSYISHWLQTFVGLPDYFSNNQQFIHLALLSMYTAKTFQTDVFNVFI